MSNTVIKKIEFVSYFVLVGINLGLSAALLFAQWTWLEMRFNTGLFILAGCAMGILVGLLKKIGPNPNWGWASVFLVFLVSSIIAQGNFDNAKTLVVAVVREGFYVEELSIHTGYVLIILELLATTALSFRQVSLKNGTKS